MAPKQRKPNRRVLTAGAAVALVAITFYAFWLGRPGWLRDRGGLGRLPGGLSPSRLNLLIVTLDTTRADRLGCYGSRDVETPHLDRLAARGVLFENAISPAPLTLPVHSSLFTGLFPGAHGVRDNGGFKLAPERVTLAEVLQQKGWATGGFVSAYVLDHRWGIAQGFDHYLDDFDLSKYKSVSMGDIQRRGDDTVARGLAWIREVTEGGDRPFFAWVHLYDPHSPYEPPEPFASRYPQRPYNGEIAWTDSLVGRLLDGLEGMGLTERTLVAVIGDHGESLGEHRETGHGFFVYEPTTRVPFLLAGPYPGLAGRRVRGVVRHVDLMPTVLSLLGVEAKIRMQGESLVPLILGKPGAPELPGYSEAYYSRFHYGWSELRAIRTERWHFIEAPRPELYDLAADPGERRNLAAEERRTVATLRQTLARLTRKDTEVGAMPAAAAPLEEDEETLRKLAALGYLGTHTDGSEKSWRDLPDPKDRIQVYNLMDRARDELLAGDADRTIATLREVLTEDPEVIDAWFMLGNAWFQKRDWKQAAEFFRKTLEKRPDHDYAMIGLADTLVARGQVADAVLGYERFLAGDPDNAQITYRLAQVLLDDGRNDEAERYFRRTLKIEKAARAEVGLAVVAFRRQDLAASRQAIERALAIDPAAGHARYNLALIREAEGDLQGAAEAYRAEIADRPTAYKAHFNLGRLLSRLGDAAGASVALRRAVEENPDFAIGRFFFAQSLVAAGDFVGAAEQARRGLALDSASRYAALGHYVLADAYNRLGRQAEAAEEVRRGRLAESR